MVRVGGEEVPGVAKGVLRNGMDENVARMKMSFFQHAKVESTSAALQAKVHATRHACVARLRQVYCLHHPSTRRSRGGRCSAQAKPFNIFAKERNVQCH